MWRRHRWSPTFVPTSPVAAVGSQHKLVPPPRPPPPPSSLLTRPCATSTGLILCPTAMPPPTFTSLLECLDVIAHIAWLLQTSLLSHVCSSLWAELRHRFIIVRRNAALEILGPALTAAAGRIWTLQALVTPAREPLFRGLAMPVLQKLALLKLQKLAL